MNMLKSLIAALCLALFATGQAQANLVTWGVNAVFASGTITGTVRFDDATVQGFFDGMNDPADTHVFADFHLVSPGLGLDGTFLSVTFQPYFYADQGDGPHADFTFFWGDWAMGLADANFAGLFNVATGASENGTWSLNRNQVVPAPAPILLIGLGLAALAGLRRRAQP